MVEMSLHLIRLNMPLPNGEAGIRDSTLPTVHVAETKNRSTGGLAYWLHTGFAERTATVATKNPARQKSVNRECYFTVTFAVT